MVSECNQIWLEKIIKSNAVHMIVTRCATSILEVDQEHQGGLIIAMDPLTMGHMVGGLATSSFAIWRHHQGVEMEDGCRSVLSQDDQLVCAGLVMYGHQTRVVMAAAVNTSWTSGWGSWSWRTGVWSQETRWSVKNVRTHVIFRVSDIKNRSCWSRLHDCHQEWRNLDKWSRSWISLSSCSSCFHRYKLMCWIKTIFVNTKFSGSKSKCKIHPDILEIRTSQIHQQVQIVITSKLINK